MKLLELCRSPGRGGLELYMCRTVRALSGRHRVTAVIDGGKSLIREFLENLGFPYRDMGGSCGPLPLLCAWMLARILDREAIEVLHVHWRGDLPLAAIAKWFSRGKPRLVYTRQMKISHNKNDPYHNFVYDQVDLFLTITRRLQEDMRERLHPRHHHKVKLLYYGTEPPPLLDEAGQAELREQNRIPVGRFVVGLFGQIFPEKGQHLLVEALGRLKAAGVPCQALIVGASHEPAYPARLRALAEEWDVAEEVRFVGFVETPQHLMQVCDVVVLASQDETFGLVLIEAMSVGTAVVGSRAGGVPEIIEEEKNGLLFEPENAADLSEKLATLYHDRERTRALGREGARIAAEKFSAGKHYQALENLLKGPLPT